MTMPFNLYQEIASIAARHATRDGEVQTAIETLGISRRSTPSAPCHGSYRPCLAMVIQGSKSVQLGTDTINYGAGDYLLTSLDLPVAWRVVEASEEVPHFCIGLAIDSEKLLDLMSRMPIERPQEPVSGQRGIVVNAATPELLDAAIRLMRLLDRPADIAAMAPLIEQEILYQNPDGTSGWAADEHRRCRKPWQSDRPRHLLAAREFRAPAAYRGTCGAYRHERVVFPSPFQDDHGHDPHSVPEAVAAA
nr:AraC family transcriptional regulator [Rhizobium sp. AN68]